MGYHLLVVLLSPLLLSLLAMATGALWPRRLVVWLTLLPAWVLAAFNVRLLTFAEELSGPVQVLGRLDLLGILLSSFAMPVSAGLVWMNRFSEPCRALRASPWRYGSFQASMSGLGILPLPIPLWSMWALRAWQWRWPHTPYLLAGGAMLALVTWPWPGVVDLVSALTVGIAAFMLQPRSLARRFVVVFAALWSAWSVWRCVGYLG